MSQLAPNLFQRRFRDLMEIGRARLPSLAPEWTDHNAHDPGITLMELLSWVGEAQLYSLSRLRRDERAAYAALLGLVPAGTQGATGLIWPDRQDPISPAATFINTVVLREDTVIHLTDGDTPTFRPARKILWAPGHIDKLESRSAGGRIIDHTNNNERGGLAFMPFGERAGRHDVLALTFVCRDSEGLFGKNLRDAKGAYWSIGIIAAPPEGTGPNEIAAERGHSPITATLVTSDDRFDLKIVSDTSRGTLTTGALLLDLDGVTTSPGRFTIELRSPNGFPRPPRVFRIEPNVIPIQQGYTVSRELNISTGMPDWSFQLNVPGLRFAAGQEPVAVEVAEPRGVIEWTRCDRLSDRSPDERVYELDAARGEITFGNGINGRIPPAQSQVFVTYSVSDGVQGRVARNRKWKVAGFGGTFGVNPDPIAGGSGPFGWIDQRREARRRSREDHALVSSSDIVSAALALPLLEVVRAWVVTPDNRLPRTGTLTLIALRSRPGGKEPKQPPETTRWLNAIRRQLLPRMPLATRLVVSAPHYFEFSLDAVVETYQGTDPAAVKKNIEDELAKRLSLVDTKTGIAPREPGVPVTRRDVAAWLRATGGVKRVVQLQLRDARGKKIDQVTVMSSGLPRWNSADSSIEVKRPEPGRSR